MPQVQLPIFPEGVTQITNELAFQQRDGKVYYFNGYVPVFMHAFDDLATFRLFRSQLVVNGSRYPGGDCPRLWRASGDC